MINPMRADELMILAGAMSAFDIPKFKHTRGKHAKVREW
jgi:hypothetical protein